MKPAWSWWWPGLALLAAAALCGCEAERPGAKIQIDRGLLKPGQWIRQVQLETDVAGYELGNDGWCQVLLSFPLPGSDFEPRDPNLPPKNPSKKARTHPKPEQTDKPKPPQPMPYYLHLRFRPTEGVHSLVPGGSERAILIDSSKRWGEAVETWLASGGELNVRQATRENRISGSFSLVARDGMRMTGQFVAVPSEKVALFVKAYLNVAPTQPGAAKAVGKGKVPATQPDKATPPATQPRRPARRRPATTPPAAPAPAVVPPSGAP